MAEALLGVDFDIHGGGIDLVFPHHENEAAQTFAARGEPLARIWMHNGMLELGDGEDGQVGRQHPRAARGPRRRRAARSWSCSSRTGHYRQPLAFSRRARCEDARRSAARIRDAGRRLIAGPSPDALAPYRDAFFAALRNDFNTAEALASLYGWIREANRSEERGRQLAPGRDARRARA